MSLSLLAWAGRLTAVDCVDVSSDSWDSSPIRIYRESEDLEFHQDTNKKKVQLMELAQ